MINVRLHTILKDYCPSSGGCLQIQYEEGLTVKKMLLKMKLNPGVVGLIVINGKVTQHNNELSRGDNIEIYPIFGGG